MTVRRQLKECKGAGCVLQTEVTQEQSMALVEYIAHLSLKDWAAVPEDLRRLGFISADAPDSSVIAEPLGRILGQISLGASPTPAVYLSVSASHCRMQVG